MAEVSNRDILLRIGGGTLRRFKRLTATRGLRGWEEAKETHTRATVKRAFRDRDGLAKRASAGNLALDWPTGLVDASGNAIGGPLIESARPQLVTDPENFGAWTQSGTVNRVSGQADPFGGTGAYSIEDDSAAAEEGIFQTVTFTGNAEKAIACFFRGGTAGSTQFGLWSGAVWRHRVAITWTAGVPSVATSTGSGTIFPVLSVGNNWYWVAISAAGVVAADTNQIFVRANLAATVGTWFQFGANAWNSPFPTSYQSPTEGTGVADALTVPVNWGPQDITVLARLARPSHANLGASVPLGMSPGIFSIGAGTAPRLGLYFDPAARNIISVIDTATTDATQTTAVPAGDPVVCVQYRNLTTGGSTALDVGSGLTAFSSAATAFSAFGAQTLRVGRYDDELNGVIGDIVVARGLYTRAEMLAVA